MSVSTTVPNDAVQETVEEGPARYAVFANRLRTAFTAGIRYSAYSSELGEAFRPLTKPAVVRSLYAVSWSYVIGDVAYAGYKARELHRQLAQESSLDPSAKLKRLAQEAEEKLHKATQKGKEVAQSDKSVATATQEESRHSHEGVSDPLQYSETTHVGLVVARRAVFQSLASMALPAFTVHSIVHYSQPLFKSVQNHRVKALGPTLLGLAIIPALPVLFDEPVEHIIDAIFDYGEARLFSGKPISQIVKEDEAKLKGQGKKLQGKGHELRSEANEKAHEAEGKVVDRLNELKKKSSMGYALPVGGLIGMGMVSQGIRRQRQAAAASASLTSGMPRMLASTKRPNALLVGGGLAVLAASLTSAATSREE